MAISFKKIIQRYFFLLAVGVIALFFAQTVFAQDIVSSARGGTDSLFSADPIILGHPITAWVSLIAALIIFLLTFKYMKGGRLAQPLIVIGIGALIDAVIGLALPLEAYQTRAWIGDLLFSIAVIFAVFWMEKIFRSFSPE